MAIGYDCPVHGFHERCKRSEYTDERVCPDGAPTAVTPISGQQARSDIGHSFGWEVGFGFSQLRTTVNAASIEDAYEQAQNTKEYRQTGYVVTLIKPADSNHRQ